MSHWYEVFDNEEVQWQARRQATHLTAVAAAAIVLTLGLMVLGLGGVLPVALALVLVAALWLVVGRWSLNRMRKLRQIVWCVKLSSERVVGYDYTRRKHVLPWDRINRVALIDRGMLLIASEGEVFEIPHLFPDFHTLSHRVVHYAERNDVPVFLDGQPWQSLDVYTVFPFLANDTPEAEV